MRIYPFLSVSKGKVKGSVRRNAIRVPENLTEPPYCRISQLPSCGALNRHFQAQTSTIEKFSPARNESRQAEWSRNVKASSLHVAKLRAPVGLRQEKHVKGRQINKAIIVATVNRPGQGGKERRNGRE